MQQTLLNLLPENANYIGDFYKEDECYFFTIEVPEEEEINFSNKFQVVSIENRISVYVKVKIGADYLEYLNSKEL